MIKVNITLTWSKIVALIFQSMAFVLEIKYDTKGAIFMFCLPFIVVLITGKQVSDIWKKENGGTQNENVDK